MQNVGQELLKNSALIKCRAQHYTSRAKHFKIRQSKFCKAVNHKLL